MSSSFTPLSIPSQARIHRFLEKTKKSNALSGDLEETPGDMMKERERLRKKVKILMKKQKLRQVRKIVKQQDDEKPWGQDNLVKVCL